MGSSIAAVLKKIALVLGSQKKTAKTVLEIVLILLLVVLFPLMAILGIYTGEIDIDYDKLNDIVQHNMADESWNPEEAEEAMRQVKARLEAAGADEKYRQAQVIYILGLTEVPLDESFAETFAHCLLSSDSDEEVIRKINEAFQTAIRVEDFQAAMKEWQTADC